MPDQSVADTLSISDVTKVDKPFLIPVSWAWIDGSGYHADYQPLTDAIFLAVPTQQLLSDTLLLSDSVRISTLGLGFELSENLNLVDSIKTSHTQNTPLSDTISASDTLSLILSLAFGVSDAILLSDGVTDTLGSIFSANSQLVVGDLFMLDSVSYASSKSLVALGGNLIFSDKIGVTMNSLTNSYLRHYLNDVN